MKYACGLLGNEFHFAFCEAENFTIHKNYFILRSNISFIKKSTVSFVVSVQLYPVKTQKHFLRTRQPEGIIQLDGSFFVFSSKRDENIAEWKGGKAFCIAAVCCLCSLIAYGIITSRTSKKSKILRVSENIVSSIWADALRLRRPLRFAQ